MTRLARTLLFIATEDWFVLSHFQPMLQRAIADGWRVIVAARPSGGEHTINALGAHFEALDIGRAAMGPRALLGDAAALQRLVDRIRPDVVHAIALKPAALATLTRGPRLVLAVTGLGWLSTSRALKDQIARRAALGAIGASIRSGRAIGLFENRDDCANVARAAGDLPPARTVFAPGAGVDTRALACLPEPAGAPPSPVRVGLVARMIRSKGVDVAAEAIALVRAGGVNAELVLAGAPDPDNPGALAAEEIAAWSERGGVRWLGRVSNVPAFWADMHIACLPSRGGEGLPRSLLEAAAHGRAIVTTNTPGCRDLVRDGVEGLIVSPNDPAALAEAIAKLVTHPALRASMGAAARARVEAGFTIAHVQDAAAAAWTTALHVDARKADA
jgi:glycosyltransferase involved in cell wall biosynthesis